ncbi:hypothetical protein [Sphingomonas montanisoli]|uniref:Uncharacterized protein n=1 Tax=Sphingomonas montanisoli TaxID=2606412 RepID=A0A5D9C4W3_9SPHN|nr:hypothetical protein [Sphingomonas montanisoli]TZG25015.1 hypothetical protein FYJ91_17270 [Sphingomonas montanisoli]
MIEFLIIALAFCGLPLIAIAYLALASGRRAGGRTGMIVGAVIGILIASTPFLHIAFHMGRQLAQSGSLVPIYADQLKGFMLLSTSFVTILATAALFAIVWPSQLARAQS